jgi:hypothetical protein
VVFCIRAIDCIRRQFGVKNDFLMQMMMKHIAITVALCCYLRARISFEIQYICVAYI